MKSNLTAKLAKKIIDMPISKEDLVSKYGTILLNCIENDQVSVSSSIHNKVLEIIYLDDFTKFFEGNEDIFETWVKILKKVSKKYYQSNTKLMQKVMETTFHRIEKGLKGGNANGHEFDLLIFTLYSQPDVKKVQILIDFADLLFNSFKDVVFFNGASILLMALYSKSSPEDYHEVFHRILPTFYPCLIKVCKESLDKICLMTCLYLIEFFKFIMYDEFLPIENALLSILQERLLEITETLQGASSLELITLSSRAADQEGDIFIYKLNPSSENILNSIDYLLSVNFQMNVAKCELGSYIKDLITIYLIKPGIYSS